MSAHPDTRLRWPIRTGFLLTMAVLAFAPAVAEPSPAQAGTYDVFSCTQPDNAAAPTDAWTSFSNNSNMLAEDECAQGGHLTAGMLGYVEVPVGAESGWTFTPPAGTQIKQAALHWDHINSDNQDTGSATAFEWLTAPYRGSRPFASCVHSQGCCCSTTLVRLSEENLITVPTHALEPEPGGPAASITMAAGCTTNFGGGGDHCDGGAQKFAAFSGIGGATITLEDDSPPQATVVGGTLTTGTELEGWQTLALSGTDAGSGIYQAILEVDGQAAQSTLVDSNGGHCQNVGQTTDGRPAYLYTVPCKLEINDQYVSFNLSGIPDGSHRLSVLVTDAAGNATTVLDREVVIGRGACNGTCDDQAQLATTDLQILKTITRRYPQSAVVLSGVLHEPTGAYVSGAQLELLQQASYTGAPFLPIATTTTSPTGGWTFNVPKGPSRLLRVAWRSHALDPSYTTQLEFHENVYADIALKARRHVRIGQLFGFHGSLAGGYIPPERSSILMEIFYRGRWRTIETLKTDSRGRFVYPYAFSTGARSSYLFRASIQYSRAYPFLAAISRPVRVRVR
jgi:hypothetical protein